jgi:chromosome segregation protein
VHLKTLTVKGFKSFAGSTTFRFEPGMTAVVGPNGSGKSNVVDAIAWVLGEQGAKALRGGQMSDVIFAGTPSKPALGRAEVTLTIDNADGALPIEFAEVGVSRLLYRSGESEYAINGTPCRLLDVQELMSDSGIGRELHVIVGQGQLDAVLQARPEERRAFVEEAAGVLKHRKRKEKALRRVETTAANLARLTDLTAELRRQLGPLGRQAEVARRAGAIQAALRDARLRLLADDLVTLRQTRAADLADEATTTARRSAVEQRLTEARRREAQTEARIAAASPELARAQELQLRLSGVAERLRGLRALADERSANLAAPLEARTGRDPEETSAEATGVRAELADTAATLAADRGRLAEAETVRHLAEEQLAAADRAAAAAVRARADRREGLGRLAGESEALDRRIRTAADRIEELRAAVSAAREAAEQAGTGYEELAASAGALDEGELGLDARHETATRALAELDAEIERLEAEERGAERDRATAAARADALALTLETRDGAAAALGYGAGILGALPSLLTVSPGFETAVAVALGDRADAVVVTSLAEAAAVLTRLRADDAGRVVLAVAGPTVDRPGPPPAGARWAADLVDGPPDVLGPVRRALARTVVVPDLVTARAAVDGDRELRAVTRDGDLLTADWAGGGSSQAPSALEMTAALTEARAAVEVAVGRQTTVTTALTAVRAGRPAAADEVAAALLALHESDARMAATADRLGQLSRTATDARAVLERAERELAEAADARERDLSRLGELRELLASAPADINGADEPDPGVREALATDAVTARGQEVEARLAVRTGEERVRALTARAEALEAAAAAELTAREAMAARAGRRTAAARTASDLAATATRAVALAELSLAEAAARRDAAAAVRADGEGELLAVRAEVRALAEEHDVLRDAAARDEVARAEHRMRIEALEARAAEELGVDAETLVAEYGPHLDVPPDLDASEDVRAVPYDRDVQARRAQQAERQLTQLGKVNPLALEEFAAMEERHAFLAGQLEDLTRTRRELLAIVREVDEHIEQVFREAYEDTAREFEDVFATLFPGGSGRLELTEPDDLMATGIEVHARPAGKKVSRLSLLSGGERSLAAIALLVAIFRARPSPFYVFDEIEAALDDRNLQRLLACLDALRERSQLIVITHQKRTMEIADALYGVSMRGDGVSAVISQRLREPEPA